MSYHYKTYHLFDIGGMYLGSFTGSRAIAKKIGTEHCNIHASVRRQNCVLGKYYISLDINFDINSIRKKSNFNPILSKNRGLRGDGELTTGINSYTVNCYFVEDDEFYTDDE